MTTDLYILGASHLGKEDPDFSEYIPPMQARRMSRLVKRSLYTAILSLRSAGLSVPGGIISGTGLGCVEDTEKFLTAMIERNEQCLPPSAFMQSTHNTLGSQIAIRLHCHGFNNTHVQRGVSFESALLEAALLLRDGTLTTVLVGGYDEMTPKYEILLRKAGYYTCFDPGEGATSFVLTSRPCDKALCRITAMDIAYADSGSTLTEQDRYTAFLNRNGLDASAIDAVYHPSAYKKECGNYFTAGAYGLYRAVMDLIQKPGRVVVHGSSDTRQDAFILMEK